jgi:capsid protein
MSMLKTITRGAAMAGAPIGGFFHGFQAGFKGNWEGGEHSRERRRPARATESADTGLNFGVRENMLSEGRNLEQTFPLARRINRQYAKHTVGSCRMKWSTGDTKIDKAYSDAWQAWMPMADVQGRHTFRKLTKIAVQRILVDGRIFAQLDRREGFLQLQPIEGDRVSSDGVFNSDMQGLVSGLGLDGNGRAQFARVWQRTIYGQFANPQEIPMRQLLHAFDADRFDSVSGYTHYHAALNKIRDLLETTKAEQLAAKRHSKLALIMKTLMGGAGAPMVNLFDNDGSAPAAVDNKPNIEAAGDVATAYMFPNEDVKAFESNRPSEGWFNLMLWNVREVALGLDLPFGVVWNMADLGGPAVRFEIMQAARTFEEFLTDVLEPMWIRPTVGAWITLEIAAGKLPFHPNWYRFSVPKPKSITIDFGRDSKASIAENIAGLGTATDWFAEEDEEFESQTDRQVYEARYRECARRGIPFDPTIEVPLEQIRLIVPNGNPNQSDPGLDDASTTPPKKNANPAFAK